MMGVQGGGRTFRSILKFGGVTSRQGHQDHPATWTADSIGFYLHTASEGGEGAMLQYYLGIWVLEENNA
jgi:hypothetical protein